MLLSFLAGTPSGSDSKSLHDMLTDMRLQTASSQRAVDVLMQIEMLVRQWHEETSQFEMRRMSVQDES